MRRYTDEVVTSVAQKAVATLLGDSETLLKEVLVTRSNPFKQHYYVVFKTNKRLIPVQVHLRDNLRSAEVLTDQGDVFYVWEDKKPLR